jgi:hypothetical protein
MFVQKFAFVAAVAIGLAPATYAAQVSPNQAISGPSAPPYGRIAERVLAAPVLVDATIRRATRLKGADAATVAPDRARFYIEADVTALIRGPAGFPARITYLADVPLTASGKAPRLKKARVLLFARPVPGRPAELQLVGADGQSAWTPALDARVRQIAREVVAADAPPAVTGIGNAFHVPGTLPGEGETQIFVQTSTGRPVSLSVLRRPGEQTRWAVALSEIVDEAALPPERDTLLWYRLACGLPRALPDRSLAALGPADAARAREDYAFVLSSLGPCER